MADIMPNDNKNALERVHWLLGNPDTFLQFVPYASVIIREQDAGVLVAYVQGIS